MSPGTPLLEVRELVLDYRGPGTLRALRGVSLELHPGECLALVGESGSGKTSLARAVLGLEEPTAGEVLFRGRSVPDMAPEELRAFRGDAQIVFQDPFGSLNPRLRAGTMLREVLRVHGNDRDFARIEARVEELLSLVGLGIVHKDRLPHELSGGQRQRLGIARALAVDPGLLILDEPVSALDLSVQAQILNLLGDLRERLSLTLLLVAHDLAVVRHVADRVAVMYLGRVVEAAPTEILFEDPRHPYTRGLLVAAEPGVGSGEEGEEWAVLPGEPPSPLSPPSGCAFHPRCPHPRKDEECRDVSPLWSGLGEGRGMACWKEK
jgi:oligopeptide/dipeptide ABC transporter ATP-binding protein